MAIRSSELDQETEENRDERVSSPETAVLPRAASAAAGFETVQPVVGKMYDETRKKLLFKAMCRADVAAIVWSKEEGRIDLSYEAGEMLGLDAARPLTSFRTLLHRVDPADRPKALLWIWDNCFGTGQAKKKFVLKLRTVAEKQIGQRWLQVTGQFENFEPDDAVIFFTLRDITQQRRLAEEQKILRARDERRLQDLERANAELIEARLMAEAALATKDRLLGILGRDIRTPLNSLLGMLSLVDRDSLQADQASKLDVAERAGEQLAGMFEDLIDLSQNDESGLVLHPETLELASLVTASCRPAEDIAAGQNIAISIDLKDSCPQWIQVDGVRFRQVMYRALAETIESSGPGTIRVEVNHPASELLRFELVTSSPANDATDSTSPDASDEEFRHSLFEKILRTMGGRTGEIRDHQTRTIWIELPCTAAYSPRVADETAATEKSVQGLGLKVLVAEDVVTNQIVVEGHLSRLGCECVIVPNGEEAVRMVQEQSFDIVLMDMAMPVMDGAEAIGAIRKLPNATGKLPILALTAYSRPEELEPMLDAGANGTVIKPVLVNELRTALMQAVAK